MKNCFNIEQIIIVIHFLIKHNYHVLKSKNDISYISIEGYMKICLFKSFYESNL